MVKKMTEEEYRQHCDGSDGLCTGCWAIRCSDTEPDADGYPCAECGENLVVGMENAMISGLICIVEEGDGIEPVDEAE